MGNKGDPHDVFSPKSVVHQSPNDHGNGESRKKHHVNKSQLFSRQAKLTTELWQNTGPYREGKSRCNQGEATPVEERTSVNVFVHKGWVLKVVFNVFG